VQSRSYHEVRCRGRVEVREGGTHIDISHGDARHDCRYVDLYLHSGGNIEKQRKEGVVIASSQID
jgi:hypothetical protein